MSSAASKKKASKATQTHARSKPKHSPPVIVALSKIGDCMMLEEYERAKAVIIEYEKTWRPGVDPTKMVDFLQIGEETAAKLHRSGVHTIAQLKRQTRSSLLGLAYISSGDAEDAEAALIWNSDKLREIG